MSRTFPLLAIAGLSAYSVGAQAFDFDPSVFSFNGFGTAGAVYSDQDQADFRGSTFMPKGAGASGDWSADIDTRLGLQMSAKVTDKLMAVVQVVAEHDADSSYAPHFEWANLKYAITPDLAVRVGRIAMPTFLISDSRKVGYAQTMVRPSSELYTLLPVTNSDGLDVSYRFNAGDITNTVQATYGNNKKDVASAGLNFTVEGNGIWGVFDTLEYKDFTFHAAYQGHQVKANAFFFPPGGQPIKFMTLGATYDPGKWFVTGEYGKIKVFYGDTESGYVTAGMRVGEFTPFVSYSTMQPVKDNPFAVYQKESTTAAGVRYDFMRNFDLKLQYEYVDLGEGSSGLFVNPKPGFKPGSSASLASIAVDFVF